ncbi:hypothetical protein BY996DRAFT_6613057 [Phakopsora pachyrhizi]|nr:hypothetical protein BY996DRAFT_6613057 [Phakopsora pachyrhizi]
MEERELSLNTSLIDETLNQKIGGKKQKEAGAHLKTTLNRNQAFKGRTDEDLRRRQTPRTKEECIMEFQESQIAVLGDKLKAHLSQAIPKNIALLSNRIGNSLVEDDQLIEGLVLLWSMTDSQTIGYHYLSNLKTTKRAKEFPRSLRTTEDSNKQEKPIIQIDKQELGQRKEELAHIMVVVRR